MFKILGLLIGIPAGLMSGAFLGALLLHALFGTASHMDMSALLGLIVGAPLGAIAGLLAGVFAGTKFDRRFQTRMHPLMLPAVMIGAVAGWYIADLQWTPLPGKPRHAFGAWGGALAAHLLVSALVHYQRGRKVLPGAGTHPVRGKPFVIRGGPPREPPQIHPSDADIE